MDQGLVMTADTAGHQAIVANASDLYGQENSLFILLSSDIWHIPNVAELTSAVGHGTHSWQQI